MRGVHRASEARCIGLWFNDVGMKLGRRIAVGRTATVYEFGSDSVVKVPLATTPDAWIVSEARVTEAIRRAGAPAPEVRGTVVVDGRQAFVSERVSGRTMWQHIVDDPTATGRWAVELAELHSRLFEIEPPTAVSGFAERTARKIDRAEMLTAVDRSEAHERLDGLPAGECLLHGDLHPANVVMGTDGPVVVDWFDAAVGVPAADVVRSWIMMQPSATTERLPHLADGRAEILEPLRRRYVESMSHYLDGVAAQDQVWLPIVAASRLAEGVHYQTKELLDMWRGRMSEESPDSETQP